MFSVNKSINDWRKIWANIFKYSGLDWLRKSSKKTFKFCWLTGSVIKTTFSVDMLLLSNISVIRKVNFLLSSLDLTLMLCMSLKYLLFISSCFFKFRQTRSIAILFEEPFGIIISANRFCGFINSSKEGLTNLLYRSIILFIVLPLSLTSLYTYV